MQAMLDVDEHHWWYRGRRRIIEVELERLPLPPGAACSMPAAARGARCRSWRVYGEVSGIELSPDAAVARGRGAFDVAIGRLEELPWGDETFDLITCLDVIEHTPDDRVTLASCTASPAPAATCSDRSRLSRRCGPSTTRTTTTSAATPARRCGGGASTPAGRSSG